MLLLEGESFLKYLARNKIAYFGLSDEFVSGCLIKRVAKKEIDYFV